MNENAKPKGPPNEQENKNGQIRTAINTPEHLCYYMAEADRLFASLHAMERARWSWPSLLWPSIRQSWTQMAAGQRQRMAQLVALGMKHETECKEGTSQ